jgi:hypothetical protein
MNWPFVGPSFYGGVDVQPPATAAITAFGDRGRPWSTLPSGTWRPPNGATWISRTVFLWMLLNWTVVRDPSYQMINISTPPLGLLLCDQVPEPWA